MSVKLLFSLPLFWTMMLVSSSEAQTITPPFTALQNRVTSLETLNTTLGLPLTLKLPEITCSGVTLPSSGSKILCFDNTDHLIHVKANNGVDNVLQVLGNNYSLYNGNYSEMFNGGTDGTTRYWNNNLSGSITPGVGADGQSYTSAYHFDVFNDTRDVGNDHSVGVRIRHRTGGTGVKGGRYALYSSLEFLSPTSSSNPMHDYAGSESSIYANSGDNGTDTAAGAKGDFFGGGWAAFANTATNLNNLTGGEVNVFTDAASSTRLLSGLSIIPVAQIHGSQMDTVLNLSGQAANIGQNYGILFSDFNGGVPLNSTSTLLSSKWTTHGVAGRYTIGTGVDLFNFNFSTHDAIKLNSSHQISWYSNSINVAYLVGGAGNAGGQGGSVALTALNASLVPVALSLNGYADNSFSPSGLLNLGDVNYRWNTTYATRINTVSSPPASSAAACTVGDQTWDASYYYVCVSSSHWKRSALVDF